MFELKDLTKKQGPEYIITCAKKERVRRTSTCDGKRKRRRDSRRDEWWGGQSMRPRDEGPTDVDYSRCVRYGGGGIQNNAFSMASIAEQKIRSTEKHEHECKHELFVRST